MNDLIFFSKKFTVATLLENYLSDIKALGTAPLTPIERNKLQRYIHAVETIKNAKTRDMVKLALSLGRQVSGKPLEIKLALPVVIGYRINKVTDLDTKYCEILHHYATNFKLYKLNIKDWMIRFVVNSKLSPVRTYIAYELDNVIQHSHQISKQQ